MACFLASSAFCSKLPEEPLLPLHSVSSFNHAPHSALRILFSVLSFLAFHPLSHLQQLHQSINVLFLSLFPASRRVSEAPLKSQRVGCHSGLVQNPGHGNLWGSFTRPRIHWDMQVGGDFPTSVYGHLLVLLESKEGRIRIRRNALSPPFHRNTSEQKIQVW